MGGQAGLSWCGVKSTLSSPSLLEPLDVWADAAPAPAENHL